MAKQYGVDPRLAVWLRKNAGQNLQTFSDLAKIRQLDSRKVNRRETDKVILLPWMTGKDNDFSLIGEMTMLQQLRLHDVTVDDFSFLTRCKNLKILDVKDTNFSDCRLLAELPALNKAILPMKRQLKYMEVLDGLSCEVKIEEPFYHDEDFRDFVVVDGGDVKLSWQGSPEVRCVSVGSSCWGDFPMQEEDNWLELDSETREKMIRQLENAIRHGKVRDFVLSQETWGEGHYLLADFANGWAALSYQNDEDQIYYMPYNPDYDTVEILAPVDAGGQSPVAKMWALDDMELVAKIVRHFLETGQLCPGTKWLTEQKKGEDDEGKLFANSPL